MLNSAASFMYAHVILFCLSHDLPTTKAYAFLEFLCMCQNPTKTMKSADLTIEL
jgi:hypothetical protein